MLYSEIKRCIPNSIKTPNPGDFSLFLDATNSNHLSKMDSDRVVTDLEAETPPPPSSERFILGSGLKSAQLEGSGSIASGDYAVAKGLNTIASGKYSKSSGFGSHATHYGEDSHGSSPFSQSMVMTGVVQTTNGSQVEIFLDGEVNPTGMPWTPGNTQRMTLTNPCAWFFRIEFLSSEIIDTGNANITNVKAQVWEGIIRHKSVGIFDITTVPQTAIEIGSVGSVFDVQANFGGNEALTPLVTGVVGKNIITNFKANILQFIPPLYLP